MAIELPKIQEGQVDAAQAPRISAPGLNVEGPMEKMTGAAEGFGKELIKYRDQKVQQEADNIGTQKDNQFQEWYKKQMYGDPQSGQTGLMFKEGNPKDLYQKFDKDAQDKLKELSTSPDGEEWSGLTQNVVNRRLNKRAEELHSESLTAWGNQKYKFDKSNRDANVDFAQKGMVGASVNVDPDHPETFGPIQGKIQDIQQPIIQHALQYGGAVQTPEGGLVLTPAVKQELAKAVSDGLYKTIDNLYNSDQGDGISIKKAQSIKEQFGDQLDPFHKDTLMHKGEESVIRQKAYSLAGEAYSKGPGGAMDYINNSNVSFEVKEKAGQFVSEHMTHMKSVANQQSTVNYKNLFDHVDSVMRSDQPFSGLQALAADTTYKESWSYLNPTQKKAIESMVTQGTKSTNEDAKNKYLNIKFGNVQGQSLQGMPPEQFNQLIAGFSKADRTRADADYQKLNTESGPELQNKLNYSAKRLTSLGVGMGLYTADNNGKITGPEQTKYNLDLEQLYEKLNKTGKMDAAQTDADVKQFVSDKLNGKVFDQNYKLPYGKGGSAPAQGGDQTKLGPKDPRLVFTAMSQAEVQRYFQMYKGTGKTAAWPIRSDVDFAKFAKAKQEAGE